jgi:hypothetical protein
MDPGEILLLPPPRSLKYAGGHLRLADRLPVAGEFPLEPPEAQALRDLGEYCRSELGVTITPAGPTESAGLRIGLTCPSAEQPAPAAHIPDPQAQSYRLILGPTGIELRGGSSAGVFYGLQTLAQLLSGCGRNLPYLQIEDRPDYAIRGLSYDVSRGKVPTLATLKELVRRLAALKLNHLQLYVEHTFAFSFDPDIGAGCSPLTADEIRELDDFCRRYRVDLVPSLASCGHMGFILSLPQYRHLAEVEAQKDWEQMSWAERMRGLTIDVRNPQARELLEKMHGEYLPLFSSQLANACADEPYDLGRGKNRALADQVGVETLYLEHVRFLHALCRHHGKRMMLWSDVLRRFPDLIERIPRDIIILNWDYRPDADYDSTRLFCDAGLTTCVCPGTWGWNRVLNDYDAAETNIRRHAVAGARYGAVGLITTDWGDEGHVNLLATSWYPIALGAALGWYVRAESRRAEDSAGPPVATFDQAFSRLILGEPTGRVLAALRTASSASSRVPPALLRSWPAFCMPFEQVPVDQVSPQVLGAWHARSIDAEEAILRLVRSGDIDTADMHELAVAVRLHALIAEKLILARRLRELDGRVDSGLACRLEQFASACQRMVNEFQAVWLRRNKPSRLHEITAVFRRLAAQARQLICAGEAR